MSETTVAGPSTAPERQLMPGSFNPGDYIDSHNHPFEALPELQNPWLSEENQVPWSRENLPELDLEGVEWFDYEPPEALSKTPDVTNEILQNLVKESIETVRVAAQEAKRRKSEAADEEKRAGVDQRSRPGHGDEPYLPIIIPVEKPIEKPLPTPPLSEPEKTLSEDRSSDELSLRRAEAIRSVRSKSPSRSSIGSSEKASKLKLRRLLGWTEDSSQRKQDKASRGVFARKLLSGSQGDNANNVFSVYQNKSKGRPKLKFVNGNYVIDTAVEVAKEIIVEEVIKPAEPEPEPVVETTECVSCLDDFPIPETVKVPCHSYCHDCFASLISVAVQNEQQWPPKCCLNEIPFRTISKYVPNDLKIRVKDRSEEWNLPVEDRVYCHEANCGLWIKPNRINLAEQTGRCSSGHRTCTMCRGKSHGSKACERDTNLSLTRQLADEQGWKQCGKCKAYVEHAQACRHMTCRCGYQFCYVCGRKWCTCDCTGDQLAVIKDQAQEKARERRTREAADRHREIAEAEELRQALAQIAEFEREEERKAELLRAEQQRLEEERLREELKARIRKEIARRANLEAKFAELRKGLGLLHGLQVSMLESNHSETAERLADEMHTTSAQLVEKHQQERLEAEADIKEQMEAKDTTFGEDYQQRSAAEKQMIQDYRSELEAYYARHPSGAQEIEKALSPLLQRMEGNQQAYNKWKTTELEKYHKKLKDRQSIKEEYRYSAKARLQDAQEQMEMELVKRTVAESKWMNMVVLERERVLGTMEGEELERNADDIFAGVDGEQEGIGRAV